MKNWFNNQPEKKKQLLAYLPLCLGCIFCFIGIFSYYFLIPGIVCLIPAMVFISWYEQSKKEKIQTPQKDKYEVNSTVKEGLDNIPEIKETKIPYKYSPPEGYEITDWTFTTTKVRGCQYYIDEDSDISMDDDVEVVHEPTEKYPENTVVYINDEQVGTLKQDMAIDWCQKFGQKYKFEGKVIEYEEDEEYPQLLIEIKRPILKKIKK